MMISQKAYNNVTPTKTHERQLKARKIIIECHSEEANNKLCYLAQNRWPTKNLSFPLVWFYFYHCAETNCLCQIETKDSSVAVVSIIIWGNNFFSVIESLRAAPSE
jgi:hypothetical protein